MIIAVSYDVYSDILCIFVAYFFSSEEMCFVIWRSFYYSYFRKSGKCCKKYTLYAVYQHNIVLYVLPREQNRNKINNLSDSPLFTFHLVSSLALGRIQSAPSSSFPTTDLSVRWLIHELLQPKEKRTGLFFCFISSLKLVSPLR